MGLRPAVVRLWADPAACRSMGLAGRRLMEAKMDKVRQFDVFLERFESLIERMEAASEEEP